MTSSGSDAIERLVSELKAIEHWNLVYWRKKNPPICDQVAFVGRCKRRMEILCQLRPHDATTLHAVSTTSVLDQTKRQAPPVTRQRTPPGAARNGLISRIACTNRTKMRPDSVLVRHFRECRCLSCSCSPIHCSAETFSMMLRWPTPL
jgi:hypothetical protein